MKNKIKNIGTLNSKIEETDLFFRTLKIREIKMKTRIIISSLITVIFLVALSGCNIIKKTGAQAGLNIRGLVSADSNYSENQDESILNENPDINAQGRHVANSDYENYSTASDNLVINTSGIVSDNSNYTDEEILNDNPNTSADVDNLDTFENTLSDDGTFINIQQDEIDPDNNVSLETASIDEDIFPSTIWVPNSNYVSEGWNPYTNGRWEWSSYGWYWKSNYRWGWATYHYGRWWYSSRYGWVWSPGRRWSPAWVMWGHHRNYEGWHPISPRIHIRKSGVISPVMPRNNNGWVIVNKNDFTKTVNSSTIIPVNKKSDIIKNSTLSVTLKQDGKRLYNEGPDVNLKKVENVRVSTVNVNSDNQSTNKQKSNTNNAVVKLSNTKQNNTNVAINNVQNESQNVNLNRKKSTVTNNTNNTTKEVQVNTSEKKNVNSVSSNSNSRQNNPYVINKSNSVDKKINVTENTAPVKKQNNSVTTVKSNTIENKTVVKENQKKTTETAPVQVEKNRNNNIISKPNNTISNTKTENTFKQVEKTVKPVEKPMNTVKTENTNKTVNSAPKIVQSPKVNTPPVVNTPQKNNTVNKKSN